METSIAMFTCNVSKLKEYNSQVCPGPTREGFDGTLVRGPESHEGAGESLKGQLSK